MSTEPKTTATDTEIPYRPLGIVKEILDQMGVDISYVYEDLIFTTHNNFLLQFGKIGEILFFYGHVDSDEKDVLGQYDSLHILAKQRGMRLIHHGKFEYSYDGEENVSLRLLPTRDNEE
jgi:hypothetical protein